jgi:hypothetical protein
MFGLHGKSETLDLKGELVKQGHATCPDFSTGKVPCSCWVGWWWWWWWWWW